jgi:FkbM family methyltransferase
MSERSAKRRRSLRFSPFEVALIGVFLMALTSQLVRTRATEALDRLEADYTGVGLFLKRSHEELAAIAGKYGPAHESRYVEEWIIRDYFQDRRNGVFLDVGANHYRRESNTYFLETSLGWSGLAVDALPEFGPDYKKHRPRTRFVAMFASDADGQMATLFEPEHNKLIASQDAAFTREMGERGRARQVPTATLDRLLREAGIERLDFMSMDIELAEPKALAGFDLQRHQPALVCIEIHAAVRQQILDYFASRGYTMVGKYLRIDPTNAYFAPLAKSDT